MRFGVIESTTQVPQPHLQPKLLSSCSAKLILIAAAAIQTASILFDGRLILLLLSAFEKNTSHGACSGNDCTFGVDKRTLTSEDTLCI